LGANPCNPMSGKPTVATVPPSFMAMTKLSLVFPKGHWTRLHLKRQCSPSRRS
jgi:hypothetical protein